MTESCADTVCLLVSLLYPPSSLHPLLSLMFTSVGYFLGGVLGGLVFGEQSADDTEWQSE